MKKKIDTSAIVHELQGSVFFPPKPVEPPSDKNSPSHSQQNPPVVQQEASFDTVIPRHHDTTVSTTTPRYQDTMIPKAEDDLLEMVRKAVKQVGKEAATQRLTIEEKQALDDIEYSYKRRGIKTSGNEIMRIATNYIIQDYRQNGENSIVAKVLKKLNF